MFSFYLLCCARWHCNSVTPRVAVSDKVDFDFDLAPYASDFESGSRILKMPSLQTALPPELANNAIRLYRECLRRAKYIGHRKHNTELLVDMVRQQFKKNMHEADPEKIQKLKDDAARGLINHILYESEQMSGRRFSKSPKAV